MPAEIQSIAHAIGTIQISNAKSIVAGTAKVPGVMMGFRVLICKVVRGDKLPDLYHAECLPLGVAMQGIDVQDAFDALTDTVESIVVDRQFDADKVREAFTPSVYELYKHYERLARRCKPFVNRRFL